MKVKTLLIFRYSMDSWSRAGSFSLIIQDFSTCSLNCIFFFFRSQLENTYRLCLKSKIIVLKFFSFKIQKNFLAICFECLVPRIRIFSSFWIQSRIHFWIRSRIHIFSYSWIRICNPHLYGS